MKIIIAVNAEQPAPPTKYGGTQRRADFIARGLSSKGHNITLLCGPRSTCPVDKVTATVPSMSAEWEYISYLRKNKDWDCLLDMTAHHLPSRACGLSDGSKTLAMMSGDPLKKYAHDDVRNRVYVSNEFAKFNDCPGHPVVSNIPTDIPQSVSLGEVATYCLYVGTVRPEKGVHLAASSCRQLDIPLKVAGPVQPRFAAYWNGFKDSAEYVGEVGNEKWGLLGGAICLMFPSLWCDAGPLVVKESLLCGTPVLACPNGGVVEDIDSNNGLLVQPGDLTNGLYSMSQKTWNRSGIQLNAVEKMNPIKYVADIEALLFRVSKGETW